MSLFLGYLGINIMMSVINSQRTHQKHCMYIQKEREKEQCSRMLIIDEFRCRVNGHSSFQYIWKFFKILEYKESGLYPGINGICGKTFFFFQVFI